MLPIGKNEIIPCPYDSSHTMRAKRLLFHLAKGCKAMHEKEHLFQICRYNWLHRLPNDLISDHELCCPDRTNYSNSDWSNEDCDNSDWICEAWDTEDVWNIEPII